MIRLFFLQKKNDFPIQMWFLLYSHLREEIGFVISLIAKNSMLEGTFKHTIFSFGIAHILSYPILNKSLLFNK